MKITSKCASASAIYQTGCKSGGPLFGFARRLHSWRRDWADGWHKLGREYFLSGSFSEAQDAFEQCARLQKEQNVSADDLQLACWYLQGQAAPEIRGDCDSLDGDLSGVSRPGAASRFAAELELSARRTADLRQGCRDRLAPNRITLMTWFVRENRAREAHNTAR